MPDLFGLGGLGGFAEAGAVAENIPPKVIPAVKPAVFRRNWRRENGLRWILNGSDLPPGFFFIVTSGKVPEQCSGRRFPFSLGATLLER